MVKIVLYSYNHSYAYSYPKINIISEVQNVVVFKWLLHFKLKVNCTIPILKLKKIEVLVYQKYTKI